MHCSVKSIGALTKDIYCRSVLHAVIHACMLGKHTHIHTHTRGQPRVGALGLGLGLGKERGWHRGEDGERYNVWQHLMSVVSARKCSAESTFTLGTAVFSVLLLSDLLRKCPSSAWVFV